MAGSVIAFGRLRAAAPFIAVVLCAACSSAGPVATISSTAARSANPSAAAPSADAPTALPSATGSGSLPTPSSAERAGIVYQRVTGAGGGVFIARDDLSGARELGVVVPGVHLHPDWSPDRTRVAFVSDADSSIWSAPIEAGPARMLAPCCDFPAWSPDGQSIAYTVYESKTGVQGPTASRVEVLDLATGNVTVVVRLERPRVVDVPRWSPDGTSLVVGVDQMDDGGYETGAAIAVVAAEANAELNYLTDFADFGYAPDWCWATNLIVYSDEVRGSKKVPDSTSNLFTIEPDGSALRQLTDAAAGAGAFRNPSCLPDGTSVIAVVSAAGALGSIDLQTGALSPIGGSNLAHPRVR